MEIKKERQIIRWALILSIVSGTSYLVVLFSDTSDSSKNTILGTEIAVSGFGEIKLYNPEKVNLFSTNTYQDTNLGFQISKPNNDWEIHSALDELNTNELNSLKTKGFLDGVFVEQDHDRRFMLTIFDIQKENFSLHEYVDNQISLMESQNIVLQFEQVSSEDDWAIFAVESSDEKQYGEHLLFLKENRLYMLQYSGDSPQSINLEQKNDFQFIMDSFEVI
ncbi:MAG: hypothetical protein K5785_01645 [Nitrosarchaeum sp.]|nr:hypothetical protein [Nitrosarchaeum sp.]